MGYLEQVPAGPADVDVFSHALSGAADVQALEIRLRGLEARMASPDVHDDPDRLADVMAEYAQARHHFEHAGGFTPGAPARSGLSGLGVLGSGMKKTPAGPFGGWRTVTELAP